MALDLPAIVIIGDRGGLLWQYEQRASEIRRSGRRVEVRGTCKSACTLYLGLLNPGQLCAKPKAQFWFHHPFNTQTGELVPAAAQWALNVYPPKVRAFLGNSLTVQWKVLKGAQLRAIVQQC
jgi:hypothetical protein